MDRRGVQIEEAEALFDFMFPGGARKRLRRRKGMAVAAELMDVGVHSLSAREECDAVVVSGAVE